MDNKDFNKKLGGIIGNGPDQVYVYYPDTEHEREHVVSCIKQFTFENKLGGKLKWKIKQAQRHPVQIKCTEKIYDDFQFWLDSSGFNYGFRLDY